MIAINFCFLVDFISPTGPMATIVTRYTGGLSQLQLVKMRWEKNSQENMIKKKIDFQVESPHILLKNKPKMAYSCDLLKMARHQCGIMD